jgi:hypothetical protein
MKASLYCTGNILHLHSIDQPVNTTKETVTVVRIMKHTQIHSVYRLKNFGVLRQVTCIQQLGFKA